VARMGAVSPLERWLQQHDQPKSGRMTCWRGSRTKASERREFDLIAFWHGEVARINAERN